MKKRIVIILFLILMIAGGYLIINRDSFYYSFQQDKEEYKVIVEVKGEVAREGIYFVKDNYTIEDCINLAGGANYDADLSQIDLHKQVYDGLTIEIKKTTKRQQVTKKISINNCSLNDLINIEGLGKTTAEKIITYRNNVGVILSLQELIDHKIISNAVYSKIKEFISL